MLMFSLLLAFTLSTGTSVPTVTAASVLIVGLAMVVAVPITIIRRRTVCQRTGLSGTTIWRLVKKGEFPKPVQLSKQAVGWIEEQVDAWIRNRAQVRDDSRPSPNPKAPRRTATNAHVD